MPEELKGVELKQLIDWLVVCGARQQPNGRKLLAFLGHLEEQGYTHIPCVDGKSVKVQVA